MKLAIKTICLLGVLITVGMAALFVFLGGPKSLSLRRHFDHLVKTNDHAAIARTAIAVIQATTNETVFMGNYLTNLPLLITRMNPTYVTVSPSSMRIEFHGGFDHFGFEITERDGNSEMTWYTERDQRSLTKVRISKGDRDPNNPPY